MDLSQLIETRIHRPEAIAEAAAARRRPASALGENGTTMIIAVDHPARGMLKAGARTMAMADRGGLLERTCLALSRPGVDGVMGTPDILEDLLLLGVLDDKVVFGSMNRGGLTGAGWEIDDRFTAYDAEAIAAMGFEGGKMLTRIDLHDPATAPTLEACARAVDALADRRLIAMIEPFMTHRDEHGRLHTELTTESAIRASAIAAALGKTSAYTWLKVPVVDEMEQVAAATTLPTVLLGGEVSDNPDAAYAAWGEALRAPNVIGLVVGRSLLYPPDDDVAAAVDTAVGLLPRPSSAPAGP
jgi:Cgl0159-like